MIGLEQKLISQICQSEIIQQKERLLLAVSGGADSTAMLILFAEHFADQLRGTIYVNHHLRPTETANEEAHVKELCDHYQIMFKSVDINVPEHIQNTGDSPEAAARTLRYQALEDCRLHYDADRILVAHTSDDQVEEFLIRMIRGTGLKGLSGMDALTGTIARPLLTIARTELTEYLKTKNIGWCHDSSNDDLSFLRNRVRHELLPFLASKFNPSIDQNLQNLMTLLRAEDEFINEYVTEHYQRISKSDSLEKTIKILLNRFEFNRLPRAIQRRIIERACWQTGCRPNYQSINGIVEHSCSDKVGSEIHLPNGVIAMITHGEIVIEKFPAYKSERYRVTGDDFGERWIEDFGSHIIAALNKSISLCKTTRKTRIANKHLVDAKTIQFPLLIRAPHPGERITPLGAPGSKKVSRILSDKKVVRAQRSRHPLLISGTDIIAILGICTAEPTRITDHTEEIIEIEWNDY